MGGCLFFLIISTDVGSAVCAVPSLVSLIQRIDSTESSLTLHWSVPDQPRYTVLHYQIRYCEKVRAAWQHIQTLSRPMMLMFVQFSWFRSSQQKKCKQGQRLSGYCGFPQSLQTCPSTPVKSKLPVLPFGHPAKHLCFGRAENLCCCFFFFTA